MQTFQPELFCEEEDTIAKFTDLNKLSIHLKKMKHGDIVYFKKAEIEKGKYFEVKKTNQYHECFKKASGLVAFLENEKKWFEKRACK